jgi:hypothetical protein
VGGGGYRDGNRELPELILHYRRQHWPISQMQMEVHRYSSSGQDGGRPVRNSSQTASHRCSRRSVQRRHAASCDLRLDSSTARHCNFESRRTARRCMSQPTVSCQRYCRVKRVLDVKSRACLSDPLAIFSSRCEALVMTEQLSGCSARSSQLRVHSYRSFTPQRQLRTRWASRRRVSKSLTGRAMEAAGKVFAFSRISEC